MISNYEDFKVAIHQLTGINLNDYKERQMKRRIDSLITKRNCADYDSYVKKIRFDKTLYDEFINYITINVSEFYRNPRQWETLEDEIIPMLLKQAGGNIKIWSAACSTGEEPYSLVMAMSKFLPLSKIKIIATDIDREVISKAKIGLYNAKSLESLPDEFVAKYFSKSGEFYRISDEIKSCVEFQHHNLLADKYPTNLDLIVCRNVLIYFTEEAKSQIYTNYSASLKPGGILFIGSTEQIIMYTRYNLRLFTTFFYQKQ